MSVKFLIDPPRFLFFTGKGGVGKTSIACASAIALAGQAKRVLLVSTDPASNVGQVFGAHIGNTITDVPAVDGLHALEIEPEEAARAYRERIVGPVRGILPEADVRSIEEQLSGACTTEIASFNEFTGLLTADDLVAKYDHIIFDTAPTRHTIRLLQLPGAWTDFLQAGKGDASCLGPLAGLEKQRTIYAQAVRALTDPTVTRLVLVARAQASTITEVERTRGELKAIGLRQPYLVINAVLPQPDSDDDTLASAIHRREQAALADLPAGLATLPADQIELKPTNMVGINALATLFTSPDRAITLTSSEVPVSGLDLRELVDELLASDHGLVMLMGKGGVGKTTMAAAIAVALADSGKPIHLTSTDPAAHLAQTLEGSLDNLEVSQIDPAVETQHYRDHVLATKGAQLDDQGRAMLEEDLRSPCTEEIAVFQAFSRVIREAGKKFVVVDTAPTGHTLLLLDATGSYDQESKRQAGARVHLTTPLMRLQDRDHTKVILVTLAETTPVLEALGLQRDLQRAGIQPWSWIVNNSLAAAAPRTPLLTQRAANETDAIRAVEQASTGHYAIVPLLADEPVGIQSLRDLTVPRIHRFTVLSSEAAG